MEVREQGHDILNESDLIVDKTPYAWIVYVPWDMDVYNIYLKYARKNYSSEFVKIFKLAKKQNCQYVKLDQDGSVYEDLRIFEW